jgi:hypothetical protein
VTSVLSRTARLGIASETTGSVYVAPAFTIPFEHGTMYRSRIVQLTDRTVRGSDADTQDIQQGPYWSEWTVQTLGYADWAGWLLRAMIGPDQFTAGTMTTFAAPSGPGATSVSLNAAPPAGSVLRLGTGASQEYAQCGTPTGSGPYTVPVTTPAAGLRSGHAAGDPGQSQATHVFTQNRPYGTIWPSYSLTTDDRVDQLGWPGCILGSMRIRVNADGRLIFTATYSGFPPVSTSTFTESESGIQSPSGWGWQIITAGAPSTRGVSLDLTLSRVLDIVPACDGYQAPLGIFPGPMRTRGRYAAIYDTPADLNLYRQAIQQPAVHTITQPVLAGGGSLAITMSLSGWTQGAVSLAGEYVTAGYALDGIANATDSGVSQAVLQNFVQAAYT